MEPNDPAVIQGLRDAIADLTAAIAEHSDGADNFAADTWSRYMDELANGPEGVKQIGRFIDGYRLIAIRLVKEIADAKGLSPSAVMRAVGKWSLAAE